ncbi:MAG: protein kinase [Phycisphaerales bacterium]
MGKDKTPSLLASPLGLDLSNVDFQGCRLDNYIIEQRLGQGGSAPVWRGVDPSTKRNVAIKIFATAKSRRDELSRMIEQVRRDVTPAVILEGKDCIVPFHHHALIEDGVIRGHDVPTDEFLYRFHRGSQSDSAVEVFLAVLEFQFIESGHINDTAIEVASGNMPEFLNQVRKLAQLLKSAHSEGLIHCDIKPSNILWKATEDHSIQLYLADWGIAVNVAKLMDVTYHPLGSLPYLSPESFGPGARPISVRDIYAFGCTLHQIYCGNAPFPPPAADATLPQSIEHYKDAHATAPRPRAFGRSRLPLSADFDAFIARMMDQAPGLRPTIAEFIAEVDREIRRVQDPEATITSIESPRGLTRPRSYNSIVIHPEYRQRILQQLPSFLFLELPDRGAGQVEKLFGTLSHFYYESYVCVEVYGQFDFVVRVWDSLATPRLSALCRTLVSKGVVAEPGSIQSLKCSGVRTPHLPALDLRDEEVQASFGAIYDAQRSRRENMRQAAIKWLGDRGVAWKRDVDPFSGNLIPCFCLIRSGMRQRPALKSFTVGMIGAITERIGRRWVIAPTVQKGVSVYERADDVVREAASVDSEFLLEFTATEFDNVRDIPQIVLSHFSSQRLRTSTMLATKKIGVISELAELGVRGGE